MNFSKGSDLPSMACVSEVIIALMFLAVSRDKSPRESFWYTLPKNIWPIGVVSLNKSCDVIFQGEHGLGDINNGKRMCLVSKPDIAEPA